MLPSDFLPCEQVFVQALLLLLLMLPFGVLRRNKGRTDGVVLTAASTIIMGTGSSVTHARLHEPLTFCHLVAPGDYISHPHLVGHFLQRVLEKPKVLLILRPVPVLPLDPFNSLQWNFPRLN